MRQGNLQLTLWSLIRKIGLCPVFRIRIEYGSRHFTEFGSGSRLLLNPDPDTDFKPTMIFMTKKLIFCPKMSYVSSKTYK